jgi:hypothetical protein
MQDQTIELDGAKYHTDRQTVELLEAAQKYDAGQTEAQFVERRVQDLAFEHAHESGRILDGPAPVQEVKPSQDHGPAVTVTDPQFQKEYQHAAAEDRIDRLEAYDRDVRQEL